MSVLTASADPQVNKPVHVDGEPKRHAYMSLGVEIKILCGKIMKLKGRGKRSYGGGGGGGQE